MSGGRSGALGCLIGSFPADLWCFARLAATEITETLGMRTGERCRGRRIIAAQDTTEINFSGRHRARRGLGPAGDGKTPGFFMHAVVAVDREDDAVVGLLDAAIWTREVGK